MSWLRRQARGALGRQRQTLRALFLAVPLAALLLGLFTLASSSESWKATTRTEEVRQPTGKPIDTAEGLEAASPGLTNPNLDNPTLADSAAAPGATQLDDQGGLPPVGAGSDLAPPAPDAANPQVVAPPAGQANPPAAEASAEPTIADAAGGPAGEGAAAREQEAAADSEAPAEDSPDVQDSGNLGADAAPNDTAEPEAAEEPAGSAEPAAPEDEVDQGSATPSPAGPLSQSEPQDDDVGDRRSLTRLIGLIIAVVLAIALGVSAAIGLGRFLAARRNESGDESADIIGDGQGFMLDGPSTGRALDRLRKELETEADPRLAIRRAYSAVESGFGNNALARQSSETPGDYLGRSLARIEGAEADLARLTDLFTIARYSRHPVTEDMRLAAIESVMALRARYRLSELVAS